VELRPFDLKYAGVTVIFLMKLEQWLICKAYYRKTGEVRMKPSLPFCRAAKKPSKTAKISKSTNFGVTAFISSTAVYLLQLGIQFSRQIFFPGSRECRENPKTGFPGSRERVLARFPGKSGTGNSRE